MCPQGYAETAPAAGYSTSPPFVALPEFEGGGGVTLWGWGGGANSIQPTPFWEQNAIDACAPQLQLLPHQLQFQERE